MLKAAVKPDLFDPSSPRPIKPATARQRMHILRGLASALVHQGADPAELDSIQALLSVDRVKSGLSYINKRVGGRKTTHLRNYAHVLCVMGQNWAKVPQEHLEELKAIRRRLDTGPGGMTAKNRATLRVFDDEEIVSGFLSLPSKIWRRHKTLDVLNERAAVELQVALAIELLTHAPVRVQNLCSIDLDKNLIDRGSGRHRSVHLVFDRTEVKNDVDLEFELGPATIALLDRYLAHVRPLLERQPSRYLFPGRGASHKAGALLSSQIASMVESEVGVRLTAHQFRHLTGYIYLQDNPGGHEVIRRLLGHKSIATTIQILRGHGGRRRNTPLRSTHRAAPGECHASSTPSLPGARRMPKERTRLLVAEWPERDREGGHGPSAQATAFLKP